MPCDDLIARINCRARIQASRMSAGGVSHGLSNRTPSACRIRTSERPPSPTMPVTPEEVSSVRFRPSRSQVSASSSGTGRLAARPTRVRTIEAQTPTTLGRFLPPLISARRSKTRLTPLGTEHELLLGPAGARTLISRPQFTGSSAWVSPIAQRERRHSLEPNRDGKDLPCLVGQDSGHLVHMDAPARRLEREARRGQSQIVLSNAVGLVVAGERCPSASQRDSRRFARPNLVALEQATQDPVKVLPPVATRNEIAPRLFVERGGCPACRLKDRQQVFARYQPPREGVRTPARRDEFVDGMVRGGILGYAPSLQHCPRGTALRDRWRLQ